MLTESVAAALLNDAAFMQLLAAAKANPAGLEAQQVLDVIDSGGVP